MKIKISDLIGPALDWAVAKCEGVSVGNAIQPHGFIETAWDKVTKWETACEIYTPSTDWSQGGPIIERDGIEVLCNLTETEAARFSGGAKADWQAFHRSDRRTDARQFASTLLIAAMRCYVARTLGDAVEIPEELK